MQARQGDTVLRIYMRNIMFKQSSDVDVNTVRALMDKILATVVRGVDGIYNTRVKEIAGTFEQADGSLDIKKSFVIETDGSNLSGILSNPYLDPYECQTNSVSEMEQVYGIEAARCKLR